MGSFSRGDVLVDEDRIRAIEQSISEMRLQFASQFASVDNDIQDSMSMQNLNEFATESTSSWPEPFKLQFFPEIDLTMSGVPQVRVWQGYHLTPHGRYHWPSSASSELVPITGSGWIITRQAKSGPGAVDVLFQGTGANPSSTTHYESDVCRVDYSSGDIYLHELSPGERNFVATI